MDIVLSIFFFLAFKLKITRVLKNAIAENNSSHLLIFLS